MSHDRMAVIIVAQCNKFSRDFLLRKDGFMILSRLFCLKNIVVRKKDSKILPGESKKSLGVWRAVE